MESAFTCDKSLFSYIYELEARKSDRDYASSCISQIKINANSAESSKNIEAGKRLLKILKTKLRTGDVVCRLNEDHYLVILYNIDSNNTDSVMRRISNHFFKYFNKNTSELEIKYKPL